MSGGNEVVHKRVLGLIGGIGSGKSLVAAELVKHGGHVIAGDQLGHEGLQQPDIQGQIIARWAPSVVNDQGRIDRRKLGTLVFADQQELRALEKIVFPWIERRIGEEIEKGNQDAKVRLLVLDAAVMLEAGWDHYCDALVFVEAPRAVRLQRLAKQRGWTEKDLQARENAQMPLEGKKSRADFVVNNSGAPEEIRTQVETLLEWMAKKQ